MSHPNETNGVNLLPGEGVPDEERAKSAAFALVRAQEALERAKDNYAKALSEFRDACLGVPKVIDKSVTVPAISTPDRIQALFEENPSLVVHYQRLAHELGARVGTVRAALDTLTKRGFLQHVGRGKWKISDEGQREVARAAKPQSPLSEPDEEQVDITR